MWMIFAQCLENSVVEIKYNRWIPGLGYNGHTIFLETKPMGNWNKLTFEEDTTTTVIDFLNCMVEMNIDVQRKIAQLTLDQAVLKYEGKSQTKMVSLMDAISLLDTTFVPPGINIGCGWQIELLHNIVTNTSYGVIHTCRNMRRLNRYSKTLQLI